MSSGDEHEGHDPSMHDVTLHERGDSFSGNIDMSGEPQVRAGKYKIFGGIWLFLLLLFVILAIVAAAGQIPRPVVNYRHPVALPLDALFVALTCGCYAMAVVTYLTYGILKSPMGIALDKGRVMAEISYDIRDGAKAFMKKEYRILAPFVAVVAIALIFTDLKHGGWKTAICFVVGAGTSALCGWVGMDLATSANVRTCHQARTSLNSALRLAFNAGTVMGLSVVGLGLLLLSLMTLIFVDAKHLAGFGFGASSIALFARVGGGIFTKAADVGADLVGKCELDIPEDDPRNPAVIADNVGDNVGDVAGMGADLFESYVGSIIAAVTLGAELDNNADNAVAAPFYLAGAGIIFSVLGSALVKTSEAQPGEDLMKKLLFAIRKGTFAAAFLSLISAVLILLLLGLPFLVIVAYAVGLISGILIGLSTEYYTSFTYKPTQNLAQSGLTGPATVIIRGLSIGMISTVAPCIIIFIALIVSVKVGNYAFGEGGGEYCVAIAAVGMLSTLGVTLATDAYGPVADNAGGIAEMAGLPEEVRERTDALDALGNTTAATGKGFAIGSAVLTAIALLKAFAQAAFDKSTGAADNVNVLDVNVLCGLLVGILLPYVFASLTMTAVGDSAQDIIVEVRRQFEDPGLREGRIKADHTRCVTIATGAALRKMIAPGALAIFTPVIMGLVFGPSMLVGVLAGAILSGFMLAVTMANAGGAWDNAKKYVEAGKVQNEAGTVLRKGSEVHKATVVGDTVGDPFKDTSGPALNILIKLMSVVSLVLAPLFKMIHS